MEYNLESARQYFNLPHADEKRFSIFVANFIERLRQDEFKEECNIINGQILPENISDTLTETNYYIMIGGVQYKITVKERVDTTPSTVLSIVVPDTLNNLFTGFLSKEDD